MFCSPNFPDFLYVFAAHSAGSRRCPGFSHSWGHSCFASCCSQCRGWRTRGVQQGMRTAALVTLAAWSVADGDPAYCSLDGCKTGPLYLSRLAVEPVVNVEGSRAGQRQRQVGEDDHSLQPGGEARGGGVHQPAQGHFLADLEVYLSNISHPLGRILTEWQTTTSPTIPTPTRERDTSLLRSILCNKKSVGGGAGVHLTCRLTC